MRHVPHGAPLLGRAVPPADGRWQLGSVVGGLYLADDRDTATAEWYRVLAEQGFSPEDHVPYDHHRWRVDLTVADLSTADRLSRIGLAPPTPHRQTWGAFQRIGLELRAAGWAGLVAPSAARPQASILCVFTDDWPPAGCEPVDSTSVITIPPPPKGMTT